MSMAHSVEGRCPFLDYRVVEWAARLPQELKLGPGMDEKWILKQRVPRHAAGEHPEEAEAAVSRAGSLRFPRRPRRRLHRGALLGVGARQAAVPERGLLPAVLEEGADRAARRHQPAREPGVHPAALGGAPAPLLRAARAPAAGGALEPLPRHRRSHAAEMKLGPLRPERHPDFYRFNAGDLPDPRFGAGSLPLPDPRQPAARRSATRPTWRS